MTDLTATIREFAERLTHRLEMIKSAKDQMNDALAKGDIDIANFWDAERQTNLLVYRELRSLAASLQILDKVTDEVRLPEGVEVF